MHDGHEHTHEHTHELPEALCANTPSEDMQTLAKLLEHWAEHNDSHCESYYEWANKAEKLGKTETADLIRQAIGMIELCSQKLKEAKQALL